MIQYKSFIPYSNALRQYSAGMSLTKHNKQTHKSVL